MLDLNKLKRYSLKDRYSKVNINSFASRYKKDKNTGEIFKILPNILKAKDLNEFVDHLVEVIKNKKQLVLAMGGHVIKSGLNPIIIDMLERGYVSHLMLNGAGIIHDFELSYNSSTSENVDKAIEDGSFGMAIETGKMLNEALVSPEKGLGYNIGKFIENSNFPNKNLSITATCYKLNIPVTVHVAFGTDIIHCHPEFSAEKTGCATYTDFQKVINTVSKLNGGAVICFGSAVLIPEIFLKAVAVVRNLGIKLKELYVGNFDFIQQYRSVTNLVKRPTSLGGKGYYFIGHHEIMLPLLYAYLLEKLES